MSYTLHPEAEAEFMEAAIYLAEHASAKIASTYLDEFQRVIDLVELNPEIGTPEDGELRTYPFSKFKYSLVYAQEDDGILVLAVAPQLREPGYWKTRSGSTAGDA